MSRLSLFVWRIRHMTELIDAKDEETEALKAQLRAARLEIERLRERLRELEREKGANDAHS
jgi:predicted RNase H-like nuclease (RuvC/YqgF family)